MLVFCFTLIITHCFLFTLILLSVYTYYHYLFTLITTMPMLSVYTYYHHTGAHLHLLAPYCCRLHLLAPYCCWFKLISTVARLHLLAPCLCCLFTLISTIPLPVYTYHQLFTLIITMLLSVYTSCHQTVFLCANLMFVAGQVHPLFILSVADFVLSILWMIGGVVWISPGEGGWGASPHTGMCYVLGIATTVSSTHWQRG